MATPEQGPEMMGRNHNTISLPSIDTRTLLIIVAFIVGGALVYSEIYGGDKVIEFRAPTDDNAEGPGDPDDEDSGDDGPGDDDDGWWKWFFNPKWPHTS